MNTYNTNDPVNIKDATSLIDILKSTGAYPPTNSGSISAQAASAGNTATAAAKKNAGMTTTPYSDAAGNAVSGRLGGMNVLGGKADPNSPYAGMGAPMNMNEARNNARRQAQLVVNAIRAEYAPVMDEQRQLNEQMRGRTRAGNVSAGLAGSDFGTAAAAQTDQDAAKNMQLLQKEQAAKMATVLGEVETRASTEFRTQREAFMKEAKGRLDLQQQYQDDVRNRYESNLGDIAASGLTIEEFRQQYPDEYNQLASEAGEIGKSEFAMQWQYAQAIPKESLLDTKQVGNSMVYFFQDPNDPTKIKTTSIDLPAGEELGSSDDIIDDGYGNPMIVTYAGEKGKSEIIGVRGLPGAVVKDPYSDAYSSAAGKAEAERQFEEGGWTFEPTDREKSLVLRAMEQDPDTVDEDYEVVKTDESFFYGLLDHAVQKSAERDTELEREPFETPAFF